MTSRFYSDRSMVVGTILVVPEGCPYELNSSLSIQSSQSQLIKFYFGPFQLTKWIYKHFFMTKDQFSHDAVGKIDND